MSEEKKMILNMLKEGKITDDEALKLLDAIGQNTDNKDFSKEAESSFEKTTNNFIGKILTTVEKALNKAGETINNIDFDLTSVSFDEFKYNKTTTKTFKLEDIEDNINLFVKNKNGEIKIEDSENNDLEIISTINYDEKRYNENSEFFIHQVEGNNHYYGIDDNKNTDGFVSKILIKVPQDMIDNLKIVNKNYKIIAKDIYSENIELKTTNGKIEVSDINSKKLVTKTSNGKIEINDTSSDNLDISTTNGKIVLSNIDSEIINASNTNGSIYLNEISDNIKDIIVKSTNGGIYIENIDLNRSVIATITGRDSDDVSNKFTEINRSRENTIAKTSIYNEEDENTLTIKASTSNGKVSIV